MDLSRAIMAASAAVLGLFGVAGTFAPDHVLRVLDTPPSAALMLVVQVLGALYLGFAALNWMARHLLIGGIYGRPIVIANLMHFLVAGLGLIRSVAGNTEVAPLWPVAVLYLAFAAAFGMLLFRHPVRAAPETKS